MDDAERRGEERHAAIAERVARRARALQSACEAAAFRLLRSDLIETTADVATTARWAASAIRTEVERIFDIEARSLSARAATLAARVEVLESELRQARADAATLRAQLYDATRELFRRAP